MGEAKRKRLAAVADEPIAWHVSDAMRFGFMRADGALAGSRPVRLPARFGVPAGGESVIWFSTGPRPDRTATSIHMAEQLARKGVPLVRLGVPVADTLPARQGCLQAGWPIQGIEFDAASGRKQGADPDAWRVIVANRLPLERVTALQVLKLGLWQPLEPDQVLVEPAPARDVWRVRGLGMDLFVVRSIEHEKGVRSYSWHDARRDPDGALARAAVDALSQGRGVAA